MKRSSAIVLCCVVAVMVLVGGISPAQQEPDSHRPPCKTESCEQIRQFVKAHYCGKSPFGNGPDDGCDIRVPKTSRLQSQVVADFRCSWNERAQASVCKQVGATPPKVVESLQRELRRLGLPLGQENRIHYRLIQVDGGISVAEASYFRSRGSDLWNCEVIVAFSDPSEVRVLREVRYKKTDADVPSTTTWTLIDIVDANHDAQPDVVLEGDSYEDHWLEVWTVKPNSRVELLFSGLGYYL